MHAHPFISQDHDDLDDEATLVSPSPFLAMIADEAEESARREARALDPGRTQLAMGYPSAPVKHTFTEPLRGYPEAAAYIPRHEETGVFQTGASAAVTLAPAAAEALPPAHWTTSNGPVAAAQAATPHPPATIAMPAVSPHRPPAPSYGNDVVVLSPSGAEGSEPLVVEGGSIARAEDVRAAAAFVAHTPVPPACPSPEATADAASEIRGGRALFGALLGAIAGALLWGGVGFLTGGYELKYGAVLIGLFTGAGAAGLGGGHGKAVGALGAVFGLAGILAGKVLFELLVQPHLSLGDHIAYHTTTIDLVFYAATVVTGFAVGSGTLSPRTIARRGRHALRRFIPAL